MCCCSNIRLFRNDWNAYACNANKYFIKGYYYEKNNIHVNVFRLCPRSQCLPNQLIESTGCFQAKRLCWKRGIKLTTSSLKNTPIRNWISWRKRNVFSWSNSSSGNWRNSVTSSNLRCLRQLKEQPSCTTNGFTSTNPPWITTPKKSCKWRIKVGEVRLYTSGRSIK